MFKQLQKRKKKGGFTLVEVLMSVFILTVGTLISLLAFLKANLATELARDITVATTHGEYLLEEMRSRTTLGNITGTNWGQWYTDTGLSTLPSESVTVTFENMTADPLNVQTTVSWIRKADSKNVSFLTEVTK